jgi:hypothetical protein
MMTSPTFIGPELMMFSAVVAGTVLASVLVSARARRLLNSVGTPEEINKKFYGSTANGGPGHSDCK